MFVSTSNGRGRARKEGGRGRDIGVRFNSNEPRNCFTQSAIICLKILPRTTHSPFDMIRNIIQCASPSAFDCAPIAQLLMVTTRRSGYLFLGPCVIKCDRHACTRECVVIAQASASVNRRSGSTNTIVAIQNATVKIS